MPSKSKRRWEQTNSHKRGMTSTSKSRCTGCCPPTSLTITTGSGDGWYPTSLPQSPVAHNRWTWSCRHANQLFMLTSDSIPTSLQVPSQIQEPEFSFDDNLDTAEYTIYDEHIADTTGEPAKQNRTVGVSCRTYSLSYCTNTTCQDNPLSVWVRDARTFFSSFSGWMDVAISFLIKFARDMMDARTSQTTDVGTVSHSFVLQGMYVGETSRKSVTSTSGWFVCSKLWFYRLKGPTLALGRRALREHQPQSPWTQNSAWPSCWKPLLQPGVNSISQRLRCSRCQRCTFSRSRLLWMWDGSTGNNSTPPCPVVSSNIPQSKNSCDFSAPSSLSISSHSNQRHGLECWQTLSRAVRQTLASILLR